MNDPSYTDSINQAMLDDIHAEFMERASKGHQDIFDFALDYSEKFCDSAQEILMGLMKTSSGGSPGTAMWAVMARQSLLNVLEKEVAPEWCRTEYERRHQENVNMSNEWCQYGP